jgi:hypothetical protein
VAHQELAGRAVPIVTGYSHPHMAASITFRPTTDSGDPILDALEERYNLTSLPVSEIGSPYAMRRYHLDDPDADLDSLDDKLYSIVRDWRDHIERLRG